MKFKIFLYYPGPKSSIFTLWKEGADTPEIENALLEYKEIQGERAYQELTGSLRKSCEKFGFDPYGYKSEGPTGREAVYAFKQTGRFRFYFYYDARERILLSGGGLKTTRSYQEDPKLYFMVRCLIGLEKLIKNNDDLSLIKLHKIEISIEFNETGDIINQKEILEKIKNENQSE